MSSPRLYNTMAKSSNDFRIQYRIDVNEKGAKSFIEEALPEVLIERINKFAEKGQHLAYHEVILGAVVPYFDYDKKCEKEPSKKKVLKHLEAAVNILCEFYDCEEGNIIVINRTGKKPDGSYKISFHFIIREVGYYSCGDVIKKCVIPELHDCLDEEYQNFDSQIYGKVNHQRLFGMPLCKKLGDNRISKIINNKYSMVECFVSFLGEEDECREELYPMYENYEAEERTYKEIDANIELDEEKLTRALQKIYNGAELGKSKTTEENVIFQISNRTSITNKCPVCNVVHASNNQYLVYFLDSGRAILKCHSKKSAEDAFVNITAGVKDESLNLEELKEYGFMDSDSDSDNDEKETNKETIKETIKQKPKKEKSKKPNKEKSKAKLEKEALKFISNGEYNYSKVFAKYYKNDIRLIDESGQGYVYCDKENIWKSRSKVFIRNMITKFITDKIIEFLGAGLSSSTIKKLSKALIKAQKISLAKNVFEFCRSNQYIYDEEFERKLNNTRPDLFPISDNKVVNLTTGSVEPRLKTHYFSFTTNLKLTYKRSKINRFINDITLNNAQLNNYLQDLLGYCLSGSLDDRSIYILHGKGRNGKSALLEIIEEISKELVSSVSEDVFFKNKFKAMGRATPELIPMIGKRLCYFSESDENAELNSDRLKSITGGDVINFRALYGKMDRFKPYCKLLMLTNHKPQFNTNDNAIIDRLKYIPFNAKFVNQPVKENERLADPEFIRKLKTKYIDQVFSWMVEGAVRFYQNGRVEAPQIVLNDTKTSVEENDLTQQFLNETIDEEKGGRVLVKKLYNMYYSWSTEEGLEALPKRTFNKELENKGYQKKKIKDWYWLRMSLKNIDNENS